jgi:hypothetical protein
MKEIIYLQAGTFANYTGTHFWNTQESYLSDDTAEHSFKHDRDVSFRETLGPTVRYFFPSNFAAMKRGTIRVILHFVRDY